MKILKIATYCLAVFFGITALLPHYLTLIGRTLGAGTNPDFAFFLTVWFGVPIAAFIVCTIIGNSK